MPHDSQLSSRRKQALRGSHPLYRRLSGDVIWALYEEQGFTQEECGIAMDAFIAQMHAVLAVMARIEENKDLFLGFEFGRKVCEECAELAGKAVPGSDPEWRRCLPPYAVGCAVGCVALDKQELLQRGIRIEHSSTLVLPDHPLMCPLAMAAGANPDNANREPTSA